MVYYDHNNMHDDSPQGVGTDAMRLAGKTALITGAAHVSAAEIVVDGGHTGAAIDRPAAAASK